jgi:hypothetical protein
VTGNVCSFASGPAAVAATTPKTTRPNAAPASVAGVLAENIRRRPAAGSIRRRSSAHRPGCHDSPSQTSRTAPPARAEAATTASDGSTTAAGSGQGAAPSAPPVVSAVAKVSRTLSAAAGIVRRAQAGASRIAVAAEAAHAGRSAVAAKPARRAASRRRGVAGIMRSAESDIAGLLA